MTITSGFRGGLTLSNGPVQAGILGAMGQRSRLPSRPLALTFAFTPLAGTTRWEVRVSGLPETAVIPLGGTNGVTVAPGSVDGPGCVYDEETGAMDLELPVIFSDGGVVLPDAGVELRLELSTSRSLTEREHGQHVIGTSVDSGGRFTLTARAEVRANRWGSHFTIPVGASLSGTLTGRYPSRSPASRATVFARDSDDW